MCEEILILFLSCLNIHDQSMWHIYKLVKLLSVFNITFYSSA